MDNFCNGTAFVRIMLYMIVSMFCISMRRSGEKDLQKRIAVIVSVHHILCIAFYTAIYSMEFVFFNIHHTVVAYNYIYQGPFFIHLTSPILFVPHGT